jgi:membrane protease YdiL (CAAX protease family)
MQTSPNRTDPARDGRRLALYFGVLVAVYAVAVAFFWNAAHRDVMFLVVMFAPTAGALAARFLGPGVIRWGRPTWWILAGLIPVLAALGAYSVGAAVGVVTADTAILTAALVGAPVTIFSAALSAVGEEIGWRGFLWPLMRSRRTFLMSSLIVGAVWWLYHLPLILLGWYGTRAGVPAFTVAIVGFTLFVGVLTDRSASIWPSVMAHGGWNALVATGFAATRIAGGQAQAFAGSTTWVGEFGWLAAISTLVLGIGATVWHLRRPILNDAAAID